jgi:hypothetical protein
MSEEEATDTPDGIAGLPVEEAVEVVVAEDDSLDPAAARKTLNYAADDGVVCRDGVEEALDEASVHVTTAESRTELASIEFDEAAELAEPVADVDAVASRLDEFESRLRTAEERADGLGTDLQSLVDRRDVADLLELAAGVRDVRAEAAGVQGLADELKVHLDEFKRWVVDPDARYRGVEDDLDAVGEWLDDLAGAVELLAGEADGSGGASVGSADRVDPAVVWFDAELHRRLLALLLEDLRAELADLRTLAGRTEVELRDDVDHEERIDAVATRLDDREGRLAAHGDRLDDLARPAWHDRFDDRLAAFDAALAGYEPPVDWGELQETFERHRPTGES